MADTAVLLAVQARNPWRPQLFFSLTLSSALPSPITLPPKCLELTTTIQDELKSATISSLDHLQPDPHNVTRMIISKQKSDHTSLALLTLQLFPTTLRMQTPLLHTEPHRAPPDPGPPTSQIPPPHLPTPITPALSAPHTLHSPLPQGLCTCSAPCLRGSLPHLPTDFTCNTASLEEPFLTPLKTSFLDSFGPKNLLLPAFLVLNAREQVKEIQLMSLC